MNDNNNWYLDRCESRHFSWTGPVHLRYDVLGYQRRDQFSEALSELALAAAT